MHELTGWIIPIYHLQGRSALQAEQQYLESLGISPGPYQEGQFGEGSWDQAQVPNKALVDLDPLFGIRFYWGLK